MEGGSVIQGLAAHSKSGVRYSAAKCFLYRKLNHRNNNKIHAHREVACFFHTADHLGKC